MKFDFGHHLFSTINRNDANSGEPRLLGPDL